jgi:aminopeptidase N
MTTTTTIRVDYAALPDQFDRSRPDAVAAAIEAALREDGIAAEASDVISHLKIELPTVQLAAASAVLADLKLI